MGTYIIYLYYLVPGLRLITRSLEALLAQAAAPQAGTIDDSAAPVGTEKTL